MLPRLQIFRAEQEDDILIVTPHGDVGAFRYQDLQMEANSIRTYVGRGKAKHLVIDLHEMSYFGSEFIGALVTLAREVRNRQGKACMCSATDDMLAVLKNMNLFKLWPYHDTLEDAMTELVNGE